jgi:acetyltransferase-like isoleucine patch superfamily enzyme
MTDYRQRFKSCGRDVVIEDGVEIENPQVIEVGDRVRFGRGFRMIEGPRVCRIGSDVVFMPNAFIQGHGDRLIIGSDIDFYPQTYVSLGAGANGFVEIGNHTHFAPGCVLYGGGGLRVGPYCNIAAHCVLTTVGHDPVVREQPMAIAAAVERPITLVEDVWLGANVTVTSGVTIAKGCVVGANAVVNRDTEPFGLYCGVPARRVRDRKRE